MLGLGVGFWRSGVAAAAIVAGGTVAFVTTNGANKSSTVTLSNANLTETGSSGTAGYQMVRADAAKTGKRQAEFTLTTLSPFGPAIYIGVDDSSLSFSTNGTSEAVQPNVVGVLLKVQGNGVYNAYKNNANVLGGSMSGGFQNGDIISMVYDTAAGTVTFYRTRSGTTVIIDSTITGAAPSSWTAFAGGDADNSVTANFGATTFARALDAGYSTYQT